MVLREWGSCGVVAVVDGDVVGHLIWAPPVLVPAADGFATAPISSDAVILTSALVDLQHRGGGIGRMLPWPVEAATRSAVRRGHRLRLPPAPGRGTGSNGRWTWCSQVYRAAGRVFATMPRSPEETIA